MHYGIYFLKELLGFINLRVKIAGEIVWNYRPRPLEITDPVISDS